MTEEFDFESHPHRRYNILTGEWILVSPHRTKRPWLGKVEKLTTEHRPSYDENCYLCPTNTRVGGHENPDYKGTFVFDNDFAALLPDAPKGSYDIGGLLKAESESGICRVINFSPDHSLTLAQMKKESIVDVVNTWIDQYIELGNKEDINHVQIFENKGDIMGNSNPHPHGQIWSQKTVPVENAKKVFQQRKYFDEKASGLLAGYIEIEMEEKERIVFENEHFLVLVPFWAVWPYETMIVPKRMMKDISLMTQEEKEAFSEAIKQITVRYDNLFEISFPYSAGIHQAPTDSENHQSYHWHMSFYPPLLRSATVKKFMVGYEMFGNPQRDITAEFSAKRLRELSDIHFNEI
ncbi:MAG: UDP-glucose--hexose-1-phosphate uridylyltransferase [Bacteroidota bacterium]